MSTSSAEDFVASAKRELQALAEVDMAVLKKKWRDLQDEAERIADALQVEDEEQEWISGDEEDESEGDEDEEVEEMEVEEVEVEAEEDGDDGDDDMDEGGEDGTGEDADYEGAKSQVQAQEGPKENDSDADDGPHTTKEWEPKDDVHARLEKMASIVQSAEQEKNQDRLTEEQYTDVLDSAARAMNQLLDTYYSREEGHLKPFTAADAVHIKNHFYIMTRNSFKSFAQLMAGALPWLTTSRPSPQSNLLARFNPKYDKAKLSAVLDEVEDSNARDAMQAVLQARSTFFSTSITSPTCMSLNGDLLLLGGCGGYKGRLDLLSIVDIPNKPLDPNAVEWERTKTLKTGLGSPGTQVAYDPEAQLIWHDGDIRLRAFSADHKIKYTLDCSAHRYSWGLSNNGRTVIRGGKNGFALWHVDQLTAHGAGAIPGGHKISSGHSCFGGLDVDTAKRLERSAGDAPHSTFTIHGVEPFRVGHMTPLPGTNAHLFAPTDLPQMATDGKNDTAVYMADFGQGAPVAHAIGLGHSGRITALALDAAIPHTYVTACDDNYGRVFDVRHPLPQITLECSLYPMRAATVAPNRGIAPARTCLYELSAGTMDVDGMAWHEGQQSLFIAGDWYHEDFESIDEDPGRPPIMGERTRWPRLARYDPDYFGSRYYAGHPSLLEYRFRPTADEDPRACHELGVQSLNGLRESLTHVLTYNRAMSTAEDFVASAQTELLALAHLDVGELQREADDREKQFWRSKRRQREEDKEDEWISEGEDSEGSGADDDEDDEGDEGDEDDEVEEDGSDGVYDTPPRILLDSCKTPAGLLILLVDSLWTLCRLPVDSLQIHVNS
ncbi:hypothetical protein EVG20_g2143 [Dentipellis fragilis]|uniref:Uncharacterized protein n=1 Tax=Dentipellis fragilis TaxID=205917 RepID=A0A4Y9ZAN5_9AGAM|nr:hypothetical protein EVG20_g2143 [Dentipellis fragilis]